MIKTKKQIEELMSLDSRTRRSCGNGLLIVRDPRSAKKGLYFCGTMQRQLPGQSKPVTRECWIGVLGSQPDQYTLEKAHKEWNTIKQWAITNDKDPGDFKKEKKQKIADEKTLKDAVELFLEAKAEWIKETTLREYRLKLYNQVLREIPPCTPLADLEWNNGGRSIVKLAIKEIANGSKHDLARRCQKLLFQVFNCAISQGWMQKGQNPAERLLGDDSPQGHNQHHKSIGWEEVPSLLEKIELNPCNAHYQVVMATKMMLMTFLRAGALTRLKWDWVNDDAITIPGTVPGLKRRKGKHDDTPHIVPITPQIKQVLDRMRKLRIETNPYVFTSIQQSRYPHLNPSAPNCFLRNLGYGGKLVAHGWRRVANTYSIDILGIDSNIVERQMGHLPSGKVRQAYDGSMRLDERKKFLEQWCDLLIQTGLRVD